MSSFAINKPSDNGYIPQSSLIAQPTVTSGFINNPTHLSHSVQKVNLTESTASRAKTAEYNSNKGKYEGDASGIFQPKIFNQISSQMSKIIIPASVKGQSNATNSQLNIPLKNHNNNINSSQHGQLGQSAVPSENHPFQNNTDTYNENYIQNNTNSIGENKIWSNSKISIKNPSNLIYTPKKGEVSGKSIQNKFKYDDNRYANAIEDNDSLDFNDFVDSRIVPGKNRLQSQSSESNDEIDVYDKKSVPLFFPSNSQYKKSNSLSLVNASAHPNQHDKTNYNQYIGHQSKIQNSIYNNNSISGHNSQIQNGYIIRSASSTNPYNTNSYHSEYSTNKYPYHSQIEKDIEYDDEQSTLSSRNRKKKSQNGISHYYPPLQGEINSRPIAYKPYSTLKKLIPKYPYHRTVKKAISKIKQPSGKSKKKSSKGRKHAYTINSSVNEIYGDSTSAITRSQTPNPTHSNYNHPQQYISRDLPPRSQTELGMSSARSSRSSSRKKTQSRLGIRSQSRSGSSMSKTSKPLSFFFTGSSKHIKVDQNLSKTYLKGNSLKQKSQYDSDMLVHPNDSYYKDVNNYDDMTNDSMNSSNGYNNGYNDYSQNYSDSNQYQNGKNYDSKIQKPNIPQPQKNSNQNISQSIAVAKTEQKPIVAKPRRSSVALEHTMEATFESLSRFKFGDQDNSYTNYNSVDLHIDLVMYQYFVSTTTDRYRQFDLVEKVIEQIPNVKVTAKGIDLEGIKRKMRNLAASC